MMTDSACFDVSTVAVASPLTLTRLYEYRYLILEYEIVFLRRGMLGVQRPMRLRLPSRVRSMSTSTSADTMAGKRVRKAAVTCSALRAEATTAGADDQQ
jgi:hypothetical protein